MLAPTDDEVTIAELVGDPYAVYRRFRQLGPVVNISRLGRLVVVKYRAAKAIKTNDATFLSDDRAFTHAPIPMLRAMKGHPLIRKDGAEHARERAAMASSFGARAVRDSWTAKFEQIANECIAALPEGESVDLMDALAAPFAAKCLREILGLRQASAADLIRWSQDLIDGTGNVTHDESIYARSDATNVEIDAAIDQMVPILRSEPDASALSILINADNPIEDQQIRANIKLAISGGLNEPRDAILSLLYCLLKSPDQMEAVQGDHGLLPEALEETLRWCAPIQITSRIAAEDTEVEGVLIPAGTFVWVSSASAGHDEDIWEAPETFDLHRPKHAHQSFGGGAHFCQGTHIARLMIAKILMPRLLDRFPRMALAQPASVDFEGFIFRGPTSLAVTLH